MLLPPPGALPFPQEDKRSGQARIQTIQNAQSNSKSLDCISIRKLQLRKLVHRRHPLHHLATTIAGATHPATVIAHRHRTINYHQSSNSYASGRRKCYEFVCFKRTPRRS
ncbi:hypothetical protein P8452_29091 [Trifolium repens]|nr:hypothetical protein P8452_29091 [Trifolium repens]